jgi:hypothetical protein
MIVLMAKNLLLGAACGYGVSAIKNFVLSFRKHNQKDDIVLIVDSATRPSVEQFLENHQVKIEMFEPTSCATGVNNSRYFKYLEYISSVSQYENVFISDTRDVIFQSDPFDNSFPSEYIYLFAEDGNVGIYDEGNNRTWVRQIYGQEMLDKLSNKNIICSGTILGERKNLTALLQKMVSNILGLDPSVSGWIIADQAILNYLFYSGSLSNLPIYLKQNGDIVTTLCMSMSPLGTDKVVLDLRTNQLTVNGNTPSVIHQYDRSAHLSVLYNRMYGDV